MARRRKGSDPKNGSREDAAAEPGNGPSSAGAPVRDADDGAPENRAGAGEGDRDRRGRFRPGVSGNRGGRPKLLPALKERIQRRGNDLVDALFDIVDDCPRRLKSEEGEDEDMFTIVGPSHSDRIKAIDKLLAYAYGKPIQAVELSGPDGQPIQTEDARASGTFDALKAMEARLKSAKRKGGGGGGSEGSSGAADPAV